jgi:diacylglycerol kinase (ATP)
MAKKPENIRFIINPISGINRNPRKIVNWIKSAFKTTRIQFEIAYTECAGDGTRLAAESIEKQFDMVVAVGGDGTINEVGRALINSEVTLGVVPAGSGNGFARNFKIPLDQNAALRMLLDPEIRSIDVGKINDHHFFNVAGLGLDAEISRNFEEFGVRGPLPYFLVGTRSFMLYQPVPVKLIFDDQQLEFQPLLISIANAPEYGNGAIIAPDALPNDGILNVVILEKMPLWKAVPNLYRLFNGTIGQIEGFHSYQIKEMIIERPSPGPIHTDGNPHMEGTELKIEVIPKALKIVVGKNYPD